MFIRPVHVRGVARCSLRISKCMRVPRQGLNVRPTVRRELGGYEVGMRRAEAIRVYTVGFEETEGLSLTRQVYALMAAANDLPRIAAFIQSAEMPQFL